jgi:hypothetical protein
MIRVKVPEADWAALAAFVVAQPRLPFGVEAAVRSARATGPDRLIRFRSSDAIKALIGAITLYAQNWDVPWAVSLNRVMPRLYKALGSESS